MKQNSTGMKKSKKAKYRERKKNKQKGIPMLEIPTITGIVQTTTPELTTEELEFLDQLEAKANRHQVVQQEEHEEEVAEEIEVETDMSFSKQQLRKFGRPSIGMLKACTRRPDLIEPADVTAPDPFTVVEMKSVRNSIPIPLHWSQKRRYLNYKMGSEISRYRLPLYIEKTGVSQMRQSIQEIEEKRTLGSKLSERSRPRTGLFDFNSTILHDAFFVQQTKPLLTRFGDMYYERKEFDVCSRNFRPGHISQALRDALGMLPGDPPPWLKKMQERGPPPSYPHLKIPGLNAPLPPGAHWGADGWGAVPLDQNGQPVWKGNPFDQAEEKEPFTATWGLIEKRHGFGNGVNL